MEQLVYAVADRPARAISIASGDITQERVDAIVNAANAELHGGGGVDGAIHRAGGPSIMEECRAYTAQRGPLRGGEAAVTTAGNLPAKVVIHVAGPIWSGGSGGEPEHLAQCYRSALAAALEAGAASVAFPSISTGVYGYPFEPAVENGLREMRAFLDSPVGGDALAIRYVFFTREQAEMALGAARRVFAAGE